MFGRSIHLYFWISANFFLFIWYFVGITKATTFSFSVLLKPWPNTLSQVFNLHWTCASFGHLLAWTCDDLHGLALTLIELRFTRKLIYVFHYLATQRKSTQSFVYAWNLHPFVNMLANLQICLATLRKSVCKYWFCKLASTCEFVWPRLYIWTPSLLKSNPWWVGLLGDFNENMAFAKYMADYKISVDNGLHLLGVIKPYDTHSLRGISKVYGLYPLSWEAIGVLRDQPSSRSISFQCLLLSTISSFYKFCFISTVTCAIRYAFPSACITILASTVFLSPTWVYSASTQHLLRVLYLTLYHLLIPIHLPGLHTVPHSRLFKTSQFALVFLFLANGIPQPHSETYQQ